jgi:hypothetical protein
MYDSRVKRAAAGVTAAEGGVQAAAKGVTDAQAQVDAFLAARNYVTPTEELQSVADQITDFRIRETTARSEGNVAAANTFTARLAELEQRRADLGKDNLAYLQLTQAVDNARSQVVRAEDARELAKAAATETSPAANTTFNRRNEPADRAATIWRRTLAVMLACFVLSILLVAWLASLTPATEGADRPGGRRRKAAKRQGPSPEPDDASTAVAPATELHDHEREETPLVTVSPSRTADLRSSTTYERDVEPEPEAVTSPEPVRSAGSSITSSRSARSSSAPSSSSASSPSSPSSASAPSSASSPSSSSGPSDSPGTSSSSGGANGGTNPRPARTRGPKDRRDPDGISSSSPRPR